MREKEEEKKERRGMKKERKGKKKREKKNEKKSLKEREDARKHIKERRFSSSPFFSFSRSFAKLQGEKKERREKRKIDHWLTTTALQASFQLIFKKIFLSFSFLLGRRRGALQHGILGGFGGRLRLAHPGGLGGLDLDLHALQEKQRETDEKERSKTTTTTTTSQQQRHPNGRRRGRRGRCPGSKFKLRQQLFDAG